MGNGNDIPLAAVGFPVWRDKAQELAKAWGMESFQWMDCVPWELRLDKGVNNEKPPL